MSRSRRCSFAALRTAAGRPPSAPTAIGQPRTTRCCSSEVRAAHHCRTRSGGVPGGGGLDPTPAARRAAASSGSSAARSPSRRVDRDAVAGTARAARSRRPRRPGGRSAGRARRPGRAPRGAGGARPPARPAGRPARRLRAAAGAARPARCPGAAGCVSCRCCGHQGVVLATQGVDRRAGLGDDLRVRRAGARPTGAAARPATAPARWRRCSSTSAPTGRRALPGLGQLPGTDGQLVDDLRPRRPPAGCTGRPRPRPRPARPAGRAAPRLRSSRSACPAYDRALDVVVEPSPRPGPWSPSRSRSSASTSSRSPARSARTPHPFAQRRVAQTGRQPGAVAEPVPGEPGQLLQVAARRAQPVTLHPHVPVHADLPGRAGPVGPDCEPR